VHDQVLHIYTGFTSTQDLIDWMNQCLVVTGDDSVCMTGEWEIDNEGNTWDDFDAWELYAGDTWKGFKKEYREFRNSLKRDISSWRREIAMEEGMLNGIMSCNDWMGC
tara:strand:+ start:321 stop:644 length:324 start_codon:yes stop_codon:yes gene_type:complete